MSDEAKPSALLFREFPPASGTPDFARWFESIASKPPPSTPSVPASIPVQPSPKGGPRRARPSDSGHGPLPGAALFSESAGLTFGTEVHEALAEIEWFPCPPLPPSLSPAAAGMLRTFLATPEIAEVFQRPTPASGVWRERSIACRLDGTTYTAQMDRVVITPPVSKTAKGRIFLIDFKTDQGEPAEIALRYKSQLEIYARILGVWSGGRHEIVAAVSTIRKPALVRIC